MEVVPDYSISVRSQVTFANGAYGMLSKCYISSLTKAYIYDSYFDKVLLEKFYFGRNSGKPS